jgi:ribose transport system ATP-binding protein
MIFSRGHIVKELHGDAVVESNITTAILTATAHRERGFDRVGRFWKWAAGDWAPILILAVIIFVLGLYASHVNESYLSARNLSGVLALVATLAIVSYGQQVLMLAGGIDLSVGPLMGLVVVILSFYLTDGAPVADQATGWTIVVVAAFAVGVLNWILVDPLGLHPMVATLATFMGLKAISLILRPMPGGLISESLTDGISTTVGFIPLAVIVATVAAVVLEFVLYKTKLGLALRGVGSRREAARMAGIMPRRMLFTAHVSCSLLAAAAAIPLMAQVGTGDANTGENYTLAGIAAAVIGGASLFGGRGSFVGALLGALLLTQINVVTTFLNLDDAWQSVLLGAMILAAVTVYSTSRQKVVAG